jgi:hypothetical protein
MTAAIGQPLPRLWRVLSLRSGRVHMVPLAFQSSGHSGSRSWPPAMQRYSALLPSRPPFVALAPPCSWSRLGVGARGPMTAGRAWIFGGRTRTRTLDPLIKRLLNLSSCQVVSCKMPLRRSFCIKRLRPECKRPISFSTSSPSTLEVTNAGEHAGFESEERYRLSPHLPNIRYCL